MRTLHIMILVTAVVAIGAMTAGPCFGTPLLAADITLVGDGSDKGTAQLTDPLPVRPNGCYRFSFNVRRDPNAGGRCLTSGFRGLNVDIGKVETNWTSRSYVMAVADDAKQLPVRFGVWRVTGAYHVRGDWKVEEVVPHYATCGTGELGNGETVLDGVYRFNSVWGGEGHTQSRTLASFRRMSFNSNRFDFSAKGEMNWQFGLRGRPLQSGRIFFTRGYHKAGSLVFAVSADAVTWHTALTLDSETNRTDAIEVPAALFPCETLYLRITADKGGIRLHDLGFEGRIADASIQALGETRYAPVGETVAPFAAQEPAYLHETTGARLPGGSSFLTLWRESSGSKVMRRRRLPSANVDELTVATAKHEAEAVQLVLSPQEALSEVTVALAGDLRDAQGRTLPAAAVDILRVGYVEVKYPSSPLNVYGRYPDPLPPQTPGLSIPVGENQPFWVRVKPPKDAVAGVYRGSLSVTGRRAGGESFTCTVPLAVTVFGFTFPDAVTCRTSFGLSASYIRRYHRLRTSADRARVFPLYLKAMADYHLSPYSPALEAGWSVKWRGVEAARKGDLSQLRAEFNFAAWDAAMTEAFEKYHFNTFREGGRLGLGGGSASSRREPEIAGFKEGNPAYDIMLEKLLKGYAAHLKEKGWLDKVIIYAFDEPPEADNAFVMNGFAKLKRHAPELTRFLTSPARRDLVGGPNVWCPIAPDLHAQCADECRAAGDRFWWYVCTGPKPPYPGLFTDNPGVDLRVWLWQTWGEGLDGVLVWNTDQWSSLSKYPDPRHPQNPYEDAMSWNPKGRPWGNGDGRFFYPPLAVFDGTNKGPVFDPPVGSVRGEMLRDGIEDYEYFALLKRLLAAKGVQLNAETRKAMSDLLKVPTDVYRSLTDYNRDPVAIEAHRLRLARAIEALTRL